FLRYNATHIKNSSLRVNCNDIIISPLLIYLLYNVKRGEIYFTSFNSSLTFINIFPNLLSPFHSTPLNISSTLIPIPHSLSKGAHSTIILSPVFNNLFLKNSLLLNLAFKIIYINFSLFSFHFFSSKLLTFLPNLLHSFALLLFKIKRPISSSLNNFALQYIKACSLLSKFTPLILKLHL